MTHGFNFSWDTKLFYFSQKELKLEQTRLNSLAKPNEISVGIGQNWSNITISSGSDWNGFEWM